MTRRMTRTRNLLAAAAIAVVPLAGCSDESPAEPLPTAEESVESPAPSEDEGSPGVGDEGDGGAAQQSLEDKVGEDVSFTGEVETVINADAFTVGGDEVGEDPLLVVGADLPPSFSEGDTAMIEGTVQYFVVQGFEEDLSLDLQDDQFTDFDGDPAVSATSVTIEEQS